MCVCLCVCVNGLRRGVLHFIPAGPLFLFRSRESGTLFSSWLCHYSSSSRLSETPVSSSSCHRRSSFVSLLPPVALRHGSEQPFVQLKLPSFVCAAFFILVLIGMVVCLSWTPSFTLGSPLFDTPPLIRIPILGPL